MLCQNGYLDLANPVIENGVAQYYYRSPFEIPKDDAVINIIYYSLYDYLSDEMIDIVLKYSTVKDFNLKEWLL